MPSFGQESLAKLATLHPDLQQVLNEVIKTIDFTIVVAFRDEAAQNDAFSKGLSNEQWPNSKHNQQPAIAVDIAPYPINWDDRDRFCLLAGYVMRTAADMQIPMRWGGDWHQTWRVGGNGKPDDLDHFELLQV